MTCIVKNAKPVSHKLHEIVYIDQSFNCYLSNKNRIRMFCVYAHIHSMFLSTKRFHETPLSGQDEMQWQTFSVVYLI